MNIAVKRNGAGAATFTVQTNSQVDLCSLCS